MVTAGILPFRENSHGIAGNRTRDLMISSQRLLPLDHEVGLFKKWIVEIERSLPNIKMDKIGEACSTDERYWYDADSTPRLCLPHTKYKKWRLFTELPGCFWGQNSLLFSGCRRRFLRMETCLNTNLTHHPHTVQTFRMNHPFTPRYNVNLFWMSCWIVGGPKVTSSNSIFFRKKNNIDLPLYPIIFNESLMHHHYNMTWKSRAISPNLYRKYSDVRNVGKLRLPSRCIWHLRSSELSRSV